MVCYLSCAVAFGFIMASLFMIVSIKSQDIQKEFKQTLTAEQLQIYNEIMQERFNLYIVGTIIGFIVGLLILSITKDMDKIKRVCLFTVIVMSIQYIYYSIAPKSKWMLDYLTNEKSVKKWLEMYKYMKSKYEIGFVLGILGYLIFAYGIC